MARNPSRKNLLTFNAGEYSPFLDNRVDMERAGAAAKQMENFICEVEGPARRRPGTRLVAEIGPAFVQGGVSNYVEFPYNQFLHWRADGSNPGTAYGVTYRGVVRLWESGTIQMVGEMRFHDGSPTTSLTEISYKLWFGQESEQGSLQIVATIPTASAGTWHEVDWSGKPATGEHCEVFYDIIPNLVGDAHQRGELWQYPDGMVLPPDPPYVWGGSIGGIGVTACGLTRDGNDIDGTWAITGGPFTTQHFINTYELDSSDWSAANSVTHLNASTLGGSLGGSFTDTIPDSATIGLQIRCWSAAQNVNVGTFDIGPWFRLAYAPTVQQGVDPQG